MWCHEEGQESHNHEGCLGAHRVNLPFAGAASKADHRAGPLPGTTADRLTESDFSLSRSLDPAADPVKLYVIVANGDEEE